LISSSLFGVVAQMSGEPGATEREEKGDGDDQGGNEKENQVILSNGIYTILGEKDI